MSLILEALRKSEAERRRGSAPDVAMELPPPSTRAAGRAPAWLWPAVAVLALLLAFAAWWSQRDRHDPGIEHVAAATAQEDVQALPATPSVVARPPAQAPVQIQATPTVASVQAPPAPVARVETATPPATQPAQAVAVRQPAPVEPVRPMQPAPLPAATAPSGMAGVKLSMHMWNESPAGRFVILNGQRMGEGDRNGDLQVVEILRDGVVVDRNGQRARVALP